MKLYNDELIQKMFDVFLQLENIEPEDFIKHVDEDDYFDDEMFKELFFKFLLIRAHLEEYINDKKNDEDKEIEDSEDEEEKMNGGKMTCDECWEKFMKYIFKNVNKYNNIVDDFLNKLEIEFKDNDEKMVGGADDLIKKLCFYWVM